MGALFELLLGIFLIGIGSYSLFYTRRLVKNTKEKGNQNTSNFILSSISYSFFINIVFILFGIGMVLDVL